MGKPDNRLARWLMGIYLHAVMPLIARVLLLFEKRIQGNPWQMLIPTYRSIPTNSAWKRAVSAQFQPGEVELKEFFLGGLTLLRARKKR